MQQNDIVQAVRRGLAAIPPLVEVLPGVAVWSDALTVDGVRVGVSAETAQRIADMLGLVLPTAVLEDLVYAAARVKLPPFTFSPAQYVITSAGTIQAHSSKIDAAVAKAGLEHGELVATVGKSWILDNVLLSHLGKAANYGWHSKSAPSPPASGSVNVWQGVGTAHNPYHFDYSQTLRLVRLAPGAVLPVHGEPLRVGRVPGTVAEPFLGIAPPEPVARASAPVPTQVPRYPFIQAAHCTRADRKAIDLIVLHTMESPEKPGTARAVANWFAGKVAPQASAHYCVGPDEIVQCVRDQDVAWHAPGANHNGIGIELVGRASQGEADWRDEASQQTLERAAKLVAELLARWSIPLVRVDVAGLKVGTRGVTSHVDVSRAFRKSTHTDPGKAFPWASFLAQVLKAAG